MLGVAKVALPSESIRSTGFTVLPRDIDLGIIFKFNSVVITPTLHCAPSNLENLFRECCSVFLIQSCSVALGFLAQFCSVFYAVLYCSFLGQ